MSVEVRRDAARRGVGVEMSLEVVHPHPDAEIMSAVRAGRILSMHRNRVVAMIQAGELPGWREAGRWMIPRRAIDELIARAYAEMAERKRLHQERKLAELQGKR